MDTLLDYINSIQIAPLRDSCSELFHSEEFKIWPASLSYHHARAGGLLDHTLEVCEIASRLLSSKGFRTSQWSRDVVIAACLWHDYGKIREYKLVRPDEVPEGHRRLPAIGGMVWAKDSTIADGTHPHIQWGADSFLHAYATFSELPAGVAFSTRDCILTHHGRKEWGSPEEPASVEAHIVHMADMISAKYGKTK